MQPSYHQPVADHVRYFASTTLEHIAYVDGDETVCFRQLDQRSNQVANGLIDFEGQEITRLAYIGKNSGTYIEVLLGALKARAIYIGVNWRLSPGELDFVFTDSAANLIVYDPELPADTIAAVERQAAFKNKSLLSTEMFTDWRDAQSESDPAFAHQPDDIILQFYTSGTTGTPKGVEISNQSMSRARQAEDQFGEWYFKNPEKNGGVPDVTINAMPNFHVGGVGWVLVGLFRGATTIVLRQPDADAFLAAIERYRATHLWTVPSVLEEMIELQQSEARDLSSLKTLHYGGAPISPDLLKKAQTVLPCQFCQTYGMTEAGALTYLPPEDHDLNNPTRLTSCGKAYPGTKLEIRDFEGNPLSANADGEIYAKTPSLMSGYWRREEAFHQVVQDGWYRTGDGGHLDEDGYLYLGDRITDMIVSGGENIYPAEVEHALALHPDIQEAAVVGVNDRKWGETPFAFIVTRADSSPETTGLIEFLRDHLAGYKIPRHYRSIDQLPRNASGKVLKYQLRATLAEDGTKASG